MKSIFDRGYDLLNRLVEPAAGITVQYTRNALVVSETMPAKVDAAAVDLISEGGVAIIGRRFRWMFNRREMEAINPPMPERGDKVEWLLNGRKYIFEILPDSGDAEFGAHDPRSDWLPAHAKLIDSE